MCSPNAVAIIRAHLYIHIYFYFYIYIYQYIYICNYTFARVTMPYTPTSSCLPSLWSQVSIHIFLWQGQALVQQSQRPRSSKQNQHHSIAQRPAARMEWCGRWTSGGANLASQSSMRAMMEPLGQRRAWWPKNAPPPLKKHLGTSWGEKEHLGTFIGHLWSMIVDDLKFFGDACWQIDAGRNWYVLTFSPKMSLHVQSWHFLQHFRYKQLQTCSFQCCLTCLSINIRESEKPQIPTADYRWLLDDFACFHHVFLIIWIAIYCNIRVITDQGEWKLEFPDPTSADPKVVARTCHWSPHASASGQWLWHLFGYHDGAVAADSVLGNQHEPTTLAIITRSWDTSSTTMRNYVPVLTFL